MAKPEQPPALPRLKKPIWLQQPGESARAFTAFSAYADMGCFRSLDAVGAKLYPGPGERVRGKTGRLCTWSRRWQWARRARAYDKFVRLAAVRGVVAEEFDVPTLRSRF